jgi:hypothetical protein
MKIEMTIKLNLPDSCAALSCSELRQVIYEAYINYVTCEHAHDAVKWCAKAKVGTDDEKPVEKRIFQYHDSWRDIASTAVWDFKITEGVKA